MMHTAESYAAEWATLTGRSERDVYVPEALRGEAVTAWCTHCTDEFSPIEGNAAPVDPDEPRFCSESCREAFAAEEAALTAYDEARHSGAPAL